MEFTYPLQKSPGQIMYQYREEGEFLRGALQVGWSLPGATTGFCSTMSVPRVYSTMSFSLPAYGFSLEQEPPYGPWTPVSLLTFCSCSFTPHTSFF